MGRLVTARSSRSPTPAATQPAAVALGARRARGRASTLNQPPLERGLDTDLGSAADAGHAGATQPAPASAPAMVEESLLPASGLNHHHHHHHHGRAGGSGGAAVDGAAADHARGSSSTGGGSNARALSFIRERAASALRGSDPLRVSLRDDGVEDVGESPAGARLLASPPQHQQQQYRGIGSASFGGSAAGLMMSPGDAGAPSRGGSGTGSGTGAGLVVPQTPGGPALQLRPAAAVAVPPSPAAGTPSGSGAGDADAAHARGFACRRRGDFNGAIREYTAAIAADPRHFKAYFNRGFAQDKLRNHGAAIADYTAALALDPKNPYGYYNRCVLAQLAARAYCSQTDSPCIRPPTPTPPHTHTHTRPALDRPNTSRPNTSRRAAASRTTAPVTSPPRYPTSRPRSHCCRGTRTSSTTAASATASWAASRTPSRTTRRRWSWTRATSRRCTTAPSATISWVALRRPSPDTRPPSPCSRPPPPTTTALRRWRS